jgi:signal transduction histidine kinase
MALRLVKGEATGKTAQPDAGRSQAAFVLVDARDGVEQADGWSTVSVDPAPKSFGAAGAREDPIRRGIREALADARARKAPVVRRVEMSLEKLRVYAIAAAPMPGDRAGRMVVTVAEMGGPEASAAEGRVIRQLGHDLRTPLTSISGAVELMQSGRLGPIQPQQERVLGMMEKGVEALVRLIDEATAAYRKDKDLIAALGLGAGMDEDGNDPLAEEDPESDAR